MTTFETIRFIASAICTLIGLFCILSAVLGIFRFRYALSRIHSAALIDTVGILFMLLGVVIGEGFTVTSLKMIAVIGLLWVTSPVASHLIGRLEVTTNDELERDMQVEAPDMVRAEKEGK